MLPHNQTNTQTTAAPEAAEDEHLAFVVGQDPEGHWLAVETHGLGGGIFRSRDIAFHYARDECHRRPGAVRFVDEPLSLHIA